VAQIVLGYTLQTTAFATAGVNWPKNSVLFTTVSEINGLKNQAAFINKITPPDTRFMAATNMLTDEDKKRHF
jgi:hypothetical protein